MKTVQLTDETYNALIALGVIKEKQNNQLPEILKPNGTTANDPHKGFVVGKKYRHKTADIYAYYCGINAYGNQICELLPNESGKGVNIPFDYIPKGWVSKGSDKYWMINMPEHFDPTPIEEIIEPFEGTKWVRIDRANFWYKDRVGEILEVTRYDRYNFCPVKYPSWTIDVEDCTEVEAPAEELKPWEKYPTLESCWDNSKTGYEERFTIYPLSGMIDNCAGDYSYSTEAEAKKARATIFLSRIARKWNEGVERGEHVYVLALSFRTCDRFCVDEWSATGSVADLMPFYFHTKELAEKSLEMFPEQWNDFYGK